MSSPEGATLIVASNLMRSRANIRLLQLYRVGDKGTTASEDLNPVRPRDKRPAIPADWKVELRPSFLIRIMIRRRLLVVLLVTR